jgi:phosphohistidine phosphatase
MKLLLLRHAIAVPSGTPGIPDDERRLTPEGRERFEVAARGLARIVARPDALLSSPLPRALETAEIAARAWGRVRVQEEPALAGGRFADWDRRLASFGDAELVAFVGHEPTLSGFLARLLGSPRSERLAFKKGGAALVDVPGGKDTGAVLLGFWAPRVLRELAG